MTMTFPAVLICLRKNCYVNCDIYIDNLPYLSGLVKTLAGKKRVQPTPLNLELLPVVKPDISFLLHLILQ